MIQKGPRQPTEAYVRFSHHEWSDGGLLREGMAVQSHKSCQLTSYDTSTPPSSPSRHARGHSRPAQQATTPGQIFRLFGLGSPPRDLLECQHPDVKRECCVPHGHIDQEGRLDIVIRFGHHAIIVVEVKKGAGEDADTGKHEGYKLSLNQHSYSYQRCLFLA